MLILLDSRGQVQIIDRWYDNKVSSFNGSIRQVGLNREKSVVQVYFFAAAHQLNIEYRFLADALIIAVGLPENFERTHDTAYVALTFGNNNRDLFHTLSFG